MVKYVYDAWGHCKVCNPDGTENTDTAFIGNKNPFRYRGYYFDTETGRFCKGVVGVFILGNLGVQNTVIHKFFSAIFGANAIGGLLLLIKDHIERLFDE